MPTKLAGTTTERLYQDLNERLKSVQTDIQKLLANESARVERENAVRAAIETLDYVVMGDKDHPGIKEDAKISKEDHPKVSTMWNVFRPMAWVMTAFLLAVIGLIASGKLGIEIIVK